MTTKNNIFAKSRAFDQLTAAIGREGFLFLEKSLGSIVTLLPHLEAIQWKISKTGTKTKISWIGHRRLQIRLTLLLSLGEEKFILTTTVSRRRAESGLGAEARTLDEREFDLCRHIIERTAVIIKSPSTCGSQTSLRAIRGLFTEQVVGAHLQKHLKIDLDISLLFTALRELSEQSYENKSITYGLLICHNARHANHSVQFPMDFFEKKRYRALSDGFRTAFEINKGGSLLGLRDLQSKVEKPTGNHYYPEWCRYIATASSGNNCGIALTRQGDILVFDGGSLRFSYRGGRWQYWNHSHSVNIFRNRMRVQHVRTENISAVVNRIYRVALDVSFRRSGCLFVMLRNRGNLSKLVAAGDAIGDPERNELYRLFDETLDTPNVRTLSIALLVELSALDGGVVVDNHGRVLAYGAVLKTRGKSGASEGSRTKAAMSASNFGVAVKVSSDGDITLFAEGKAFLEL